MRFNPMSLAPTQMEQATCGNRGQRVADEDLVASSTGKFKRKTIPSTRRIACEMQRQQRGGRHEGDQQAQRECVE